LIKCPICGEPIRVYVRYNQACILSTSGSLFEVGPITAEEDEPTYFVTCSANFTHFEMEAYSTEEIIEACRAGYTS
jgi:hypothetical protein